MVCNNTASYAAWVCRSKYPHLQELPVMYNFTDDEQEQNFKLDIVFGFTPGQLRSNNYFKTASANNGGQYVHTDCRN